MKSNSESERRERQDWGIVLIILLIGFLCVILAGQQALRLSPSWKLNANMESGIDPNRNFLTDKPASFIEPVDANILTQPAWVRVFLTPGAKFSTGTPRPLPAANTKAASTEASTAVPLTNTIPVNTNTAVPTNTFVWLPLPATNTPKPPKPNTPTNTSAPPPVVLPSADLWITNNDGVSNYLLGNLLTYTVVVTNAGPDAVSGALVTGIIPTQLTNWDWACTSIVNASGCNPMNDNTNFNDTVDLAVGGSITYTVTTTVPAGATGNLVHTASVAAPAGYTDPGGNNAVTDTDVPPAADLQITMTDNATIYLPGSNRTYWITISNPAGPLAITGASVIDNFIVPISGASWICSGSNGGVCTAGPVAGNINDVIDLPVTGSVTYRVDVTTAGAMDLSNTASVTLPLGYFDPSSPNTATDTDTLFLAPGPPPVGLETPGTPPGTGCNLLNAGDVLTFSIPVPIVDGDPIDLIYYEELQTLPLPFPPGTPGILMDKIVIEISDGLNWITALDWGDGAPNNYTTNLVNSPCGAETDNCPIDGATLINNVGIGIDVPDSLQNGPNTYIRVSVRSPELPPDDGNVCVDALVQAP